MCRGRTLWLIGAIASQLAGTASASAPPAKGTVSLTLYAGSRGTGVPPAALERLHEVRRLLDRQKEALPHGRLRYAQSTAGLEGEQRLCVELAPGPRSAELIAQVRTMVAGTPMLSVSEAPCPPAVDGPARPGPR